MPLELQRMLQGPTQTLQWRAKSLTLATPQIEIDRVTGAGFFFFLPRRWIGCAAPRRVGSEAADWTHFFFRSLSVVLDDLGSSLPWKAAEKPLWICRKQRAELSVCSLQQRQANKQKNSQGFQCHNKKRHSVCSAGGKQGCIRTWLGMWPLIRESVQGPLWHFPSDVTV